MGKGLRDLVIIVFPISLMNHTNKFFVDVIGGCDAGY
jgi:hypothetical protein